MLEFVSLRPVMRLWFCQRYCFRSQLLEYKVKFWIPFLRWRFIPVFPGFAFWSVKPHRRPFPFIHVSGKFAPRGACLLCLTGARSFGGGGSDWGAQGPL